MPLSRFIDYYMQGLRFSCRVCVLNTEEVVIALLVINGFYRIMLVELSWIVHVYGVSADTGFLKNKHCGNVTYDISCPCEI